MNEKVSVIIPVYNAEKTIKRCLKSILNQTYNNIELIIVDDGSTDKTSEEIDKILKSNTYNIKVIKQENQGVSAARNKGIENSTGKYIIFVDSDDELFFNAVEMLVNMQTEGFVIGNIDVKNKIINKSSNNIIKGKISDLFSYLFIEKNILNYPVGKLYNKNIIDEKNIGFKKGLNLGEDLIFNLEYLENCSEVVYIDKFLYTYFNDTENSLSKQYYDDMVGVQKKLIDTIIECIDKINISSIDKKHVYRKCIILYMSAVSQELKAKKFLKAKKVMSDERMQSFFKILRQKKYINYLLYFILKHKLYITYFLTRNFTLNDIYACKK